MKAIHASRSVCAITTTTRPLNLKEALEAARPKLEKILERKRTNEEIRLAEIARQRKLQPESLEKIQKTVDFILLYQFWVSIKNKKNVFYFVQFYAN